MDGYRLIGVDGQRFYAHRLAWMLTYGGWPSALIDHRNGDRDDNRIENLREATHLQNRHNRKSEANRDSSHGFLGVARNGRRWSAHIWADGRFYHLGQHDTPEEASAAYRAAKERLHPTWERQCASKPS